ncbi:MAG: 3-hydroxypropionyl-coenzyme A dehydratase [Candidatus Lokiarchaeum sp. GC14_75]|nr:MAG: 3-hydroxypropionyl-coenzyme A dehydratase [Candidatus Lokiarchaeum sp. GC14_75]
MNVEDIESIIYEKEDNGICTATISRPDKRNAVSVFSFLEIRTILNDMEKDENAKVLIITGDPRGRAFSSGAFFDSEMLKNASKELLNEIDLNDIAQKETTLSLFKFKKPIIAAINGLAIGGAYTMLLVGADLIYMAEDAWLGLYFSQRAIIPEFGSSFLLPLLVGFQKAKEICYFGENISAQEAEKLGLVNKVLPNDELIPFAREQALRLIPPKGPTAAIQSMKRTMHSYYINILSSTLDLENEGMRKAFASSDFRESIRSLQEKREPTFTGK